MFNVGDPVNVISGPMQGTKAIVDEIIYRQTGTKEVAWYSVKHKDFLLDGRVKNIPPNTPENHYFFTAITPECLELAVQ